MFMKKINYTINLTHHYLGGRYHKFSATEEPLGPEANSITFDFLDHTIKIFLTPEKLKYELLAFTKNELN